MFQGKYFGPSSPCDDNSLSTDLSEAGSEALAKHYLADASASYTHGDEGVSFTERFHTCNCQSCLKKLRTLSEKIINSANH